MLRSSLALGFLAVLLAGVGCGTSPGEAPGGGGSTSSGNGGTAGHAGGVPASPTPACYPGESPPGAAIPDSAQKGTGPCAGKTLADVLATLHATYGEWDDVTDYASEGPLTPSSFEYAFARPDGGFAIVLERGSGDCESGCTDRMYGYFETDGACAPLKAGNYHVGVGAMRESCIAEEGTPRWGVPNPQDPALLCGADNTPLSIGGDYTVHLSGLSSPCSPPGGETQSTVDGTLALTIAQDTADPSTGTVTVTGTGNPLIDGRVLQATFERRRFVVNEDVMSTGSCLENHTLELRYDFEGGCGLVHLFEFGTGCIECKGDYDVALGPG